MPPPGRTSEGRRRRPTVIDSTGHPSGAPLALHLLVALHLLAD
jgi:hypothetical protein